ncbi:MAG: carboxylating nicotinate-nucleotide diphosphorylase [Ardenticatenia bacterium]|nr:carboxylating nicotinate-nucleotide diphosphorylase [Ardenticatenia bacterium]
MVRWSHQHSFAQVALAMSSTARIQVDSLFPGLPQDQAHAAIETIRRALDEDIGPGDVTTSAVITEPCTARGHIVVKAHGVIAGLAVARATFTLVDARVIFTPLVPDGASVRPGEVVATVEGLVNALLTGERVALNFLQRMSGIATLTRRFVEAVAHTSAVILDTRKTVPGLRPLDKWAVRLGGAQNHRAGLHDMVLIKENHIAAAGSLAEAVRRVRARWGHRYPVEVEVRTLEELDAALALDVDRVLLDNMDVPTLRAAVAMTAGRVPLEASGGITLDNVAAVAETGVDFISVGALTHSPPALDITLLLTEIVNTGR